MTQQAERQLERQGERAAIGGAAGGAAGDGQRREKVYYLSKTDLFRDLGQEQLQELERSVAMNTCRRGRVFFSPGETGEVLFILKKGRVNLYRINPDGKKLVTASVEPGTVFGEMSLVGQGMHDTFAEAAEECTLCVMSRSDVEHLLLSKPRVGLRFMELLANRLREVEDAGSKLLTSGGAPEPARSAEPPTMYGTCSASLASTPAECTRVGFATPAMPSQSSSERFAGSLRSRAISQAAARSG